jgi:hypothetical protein
VKIHTEKIRLREIGSRNNKNNKNNSGKIRRIGEMDGNGEIAQIDHRRR